nr:bifunctional diaminohydroxyphosphoribosylaminopyrimidine deaminase/5-amino-6-(5-phosphoribosylamino)uracil reductase RibD [Oceanococcus sp. HetDA_MAG_MS8]
MAFSATDARWMAQALRLAESATWAARPNPRVGCVLVSADGRLVGEGQTQALGGPHAEVMALRIAGKQAQGSTAYVTLEPCNHTGRTGPCAQALIEAGVSRVVCAARDPSPQAGGGLATLRAAGLSAESGLLAASAEAQMVGFLSRMRRGRPWIRLKMAGSMDGRSALPDGRSQWITGPAARRDGHRWRARACAIVSSAQTVLADGAQLTVRAVAVDEQPQRVVVDRRAILDGSQKVFDAQAPTHHLQGAQWDVATVVQFLSELPANEVLLECGPTMAAAWLRGGYVDELVIYTNPSLIGEGRPLVELPALGDLQERLQLQITDIRRLGDDCRIMANPIAPAS